MGLLNIAKTLNSGKDLAGNDLDEPTNFYIGATGNPGAPDLEIERQKLAAKIKNGAHFVTNTTNLRFRTSKTLHR